MPAPKGLTQSPIDDASEATTSRRGLRSNADSVEAPAGPHSAVDPNRGGDIARRHGGALDAAIVQFGGCRSAWLDLSTGINPAPPPLPTLDPALFMRLPEAALEAETCAAARCRYGAPVEAEIVTAPGTQALISALPQLLARANAGGIGGDVVAIVEPTYGEHRAAFAAAGYEVVGVNSLAEMPDTVTIAVVVNPNNPDGRVFAHSDLCALADKLAARGGLLIVDEAFADVDPSHSLAGETGRSGLLVHRSFGKFFGLAGLRLGFALTDPMLGRALRERLGAWAVSGPALAIGAAWLADEGLCADIRASIAQQAVLRDACLDHAGLSPVGATALFATVAHPQAGDLFDALAARHILTRPFAYAPTWLRFGNPRDAVEAARLTQALREVLGDAEDEIARRDRAPAFDPNAAARVQ